MDNKPTPKWSIDKDNNLIPYKKEKIEHHDTGGKKQTRKHIDRKNPNRNIWETIGISNSSSSNSNNILRRHNSGSSLHSEDDSDKNKCSSSVGDNDNYKNNIINSIDKNNSKNSSSSKDESGSLYAINLERCETLSSESFSGSDNDGICNNISTVMETSIYENEDVLDNNQVYTHYTDGSDSESVDLCADKKNSAIKIRMMEPGNGDVVPAKKRNLGKISQKRGDTLTQLISTDVWIGREKQTITKPKERIPSSNLVTKKSGKNKSSPSKEYTTKKSVDSEETIPDAA